MRHLKLTVLAPTSCSSFARDTYPNVSHPFLSSDLLDDHSVCLLTRHISASVLQSLSSTRAWWECLAQQRERPASGCEADAHGALVAASTAAAARAPVG